MNSKYNVQSRKKILDFGTKDTIYIYIFYKILYTFYYM